MSVKKVASNLEWQAWGKRDPLFAVATWRGKEKGGSTPWTEEEFYDLGRRDWEFYHGHWQEYGVDHTACVEIGSGAGRITRQLVRDFGKVHALDVSPDMIAHARRQVSGDRVEFHLTHGNNIPLPDDSVSAIFSCAVFLHFDTLAIARKNFEEAHRVLNSGGTMMIQLPAHMWPRPVRIHKMLHLVWRGLAHTKMAVNRIRYRLGMCPHAMRTLNYPVEWLFRELPQIGFQRVQIELVPFGTNGGSAAFVFATKR